MKKEIEEIIDSHLREMIHKQIEESNDRIYNSIANILCAEGYMVIKEDVEEIFKKALAYDKLGEMYDVVSFEGVYTECGKRYKELESELNHIKDTLRELLGETE